MQVSGEGGTLARFGTFYLYRPLCKNTSEVRMLRVLVRSFALVGIAALTACQGSMGSNAMMPSSASGAGAFPMAAGDGEIPLTRAGAVNRVCPEVNDPGQMRCFALERSDLRRNDENPNATHAGYGPDDLKAAYNLPQGKPTLIAIVDAYGYPKASADLAAYRSYYKFAACTTGNGCLRIRNQTGGTNPPPTDASWSGEQALDLDMASALCQACKLLLIQANSNSGANLYAAVAEAVKLGAVVISNSYGISESRSCQGGGQASNSTFSTPGHTFVAAAGDLGGGLLDCGGPQQPCSLSTVVCVGGTRLVKSNTKRGWSETVWNELADDFCNGSCGGTGSGCSTVVKKPSWQTDTGCKNRSESDVSAEASVLTPVAVYFSGYGGWTAFGGTSASTPIIAGIIGRAGNGATINAPQHIWLNKAHLYDITSGNNVYAQVTGACASAVHYICYAQAGYDGPTGLGTPNGLGAF
ncbi:MAG TPA: S8 family serine peptidase [Candidatus Tumulicola sp.]|jgi:subtilase family serine protease